MNLEKESIQQRSDTKNHKFAIVVSIVTATISFFYLYASASTLKIPIFTFTERITFPTTFNSFVISQSIDLTIIVGLFLIWSGFSIKNTKIKFTALAAILSSVGISLLSGNQLIMEIIAFSSLPVMITLILFDKFREKKILNNFFNPAKKFFAIEGLILGISSLFLASITLFGIDSTQVIPQNHVQEIFVLFAGLSPFFIFVLFFCYPIKLLTVPIVRRFEKNNLDLNFKYNLKANWKITFLIIIIFFSIFMSLIPHLDEINPESKVVSFDTSYYVDWITSLSNSKDTSQFMQRAFVEQNQGDRPFSLIIFYGISKLNLADLESSIDYLPLILSPLLVLSVYFFTRELTSNEITALLASFLTVVSYQTLGGIYAGFFANWFALILGISSLIFLFRFLKNNGNVNLIIFSVLLLLTLFSHVYTWTFLSVLLVVFLLVSYKMKYFEKKNIMILLLIVFSIVVVDVAKTISTGSAGGIEQDILFLSSEEKFSLEKIGTSWTDSLFVSTTILGGTIGNFVLFALSLYWLFRSNMHKSYNVFIMISFSLGVFPLLFGNIMMQTRILYDISIQIPAAIALTHISRQMDWKLFLPIVIIWLVSYSITLLSNFVLVFPR